jgi:hypothetical protein
MSVFTQAVDLYCNSALGRGASPATATRGEAATRAATALRAVRDEDRFHYRHHPGRYGETHRIWTNRTWGPWQVGPSSANDEIHVDPSATGSVTLTAWVLAHEGVHAAFNQGWFDDPVTEEILCYTNQIAFYQELKAGIALGGNTYDVDASHSFYREAEVLLRKFESHQLVDWILVEHPNYRSDLTAAWVRTNQQYWGGLSIRSPQTRGLYIRALLDARPTPSDWILVIQMLMNANTRAEIDVILTWIEVGGDAAPSVNLASDGWARIRAAQGTQRLPNIDSISRTWGLP